MNETVVVKVGMKMIERRKREAGDKGVDRERKLPAVQVSKTEHTQNAIPHSTHTVLPRALVLGNAS